MLWRRELTWAVKLYGMEKGQEDFLEEGGWCGREG